MSTKTRKLITLNTEDWRAGYDAGAAGKPGTPIPPGRDALAYLSGWIEGDAKRQGYGGTRR